MKTGNCQSLPTFCIDIYLLPTYIRTSGSPRCTAYFQPQYCPLLSNPIVVLSSDSLEADLSELSTDTPTVRLSVKNTYIINILFAINIGR